MVDPDKHMRFSGLVKKTHLLSATVFVGFVAAHGGCTPVTCPPGYEGPLDNREGQVDPNSDAAYYCFDITPPPPPPPPPPPDLGGMKPPDPPGPKDRDAVAKAALFVHSCIPGLFPDFNVNGHIDATYSAIMRASVERVILERVNCFKDKTNGCDAVRECLGIEYTRGDPGVAAGCSDGVSLYRDNSVNEWVNCTGLGLDCWNGAYLMCGLPTTPCNEAEPPSCTADGVPQRCMFFTDELGALAEVEPSCATYGLACAADADKAFCTGTGPACDKKFRTGGNFLADFRAGIACENETTLRACVNGHEQLVDCTKQGQEFRCIGGSRPRCGFDFQCDQRDIYAPINEDRLMEATCEGSLINLCNSGVRTTIDCKSLGFNTCDPFWRTCSY